MNDRTAAFFALLVPNVLSGLVMAWAVFLKRDNLRPWGRLVAEICLAVGWAAILLAIVQGAKSMPAWACIPIGFVSFKVAGLIAHFKMFERFPTLVNGDNGPLLPQSAQGVSPRS
jgi:hypothetical protein